MGQEMPMQSRKAGRKEARKEERREEERKSGEKKPNCCGGSGFRFRILIPEFAFLCIFSCFPFFLPSCSALASLLPFLIWLPGERGGGGHGVEKVSIRTFPS
jgi:hypothetical protein